MALVSLNDREINHIKKMFWVDDGEKNESVWIGMALQKCFGSSIFQVDPVSIQNNEVKLSNGKILEFVVDGQANNFTITKSMWDFNNKERLFILVDFCDTKKQIQIKGIQESKKVFDGANLKVENTGLAYFVGFFELAPKIIEKKLKNFGCCCVDLVRKDIEI